MTDRSVATDERPTIAERYSASVSNGVGQEHIILAAGMQHERLGILLLRLQSEYDAVRQDLERAGHIAPRRIDQAREFDRRARLATRLRDFDTAETLTKMAAECRSRTSAEVLSARAFVLMGLKTLREARQQFGALAVSLAAKRQISSDAGLKLAGRVLDVWLDPTCHVCDGTGVIGSRYAGQTEHQCGTCCGTGHRRDIVGNSPADRKFASDLLAEAQHRAAAAARGMGRFMAPADA